MKPILLLTDEIGAGNPTLQDIAGIPVKVSQSAGAPGCNCDRWGHPCPDCVERNVQPDAELPISAGAKSTRSFNAVHQQARS
jgi:hypothetical protein